MYTIAVVNQKGGCGKTTTAVNLAAALAARGRRTLLVDLDPQAHASLALGFLDEGDEKNLYDVLIDPYLPIATIVRRQSELLHFVPGNVVLHAIEQILSGAPQRENRLRLKLEPLVSDYHYVIIDCPPAVGLLTINALSAADLALVTVETAFFALHGLAKLHETIDLVRRETKREIAVRALCTMFDRRTRYANEVHDEIRRHLEERTFATTIRANVKLGEAASHGKPVIEYAPHSHGAEDYLALADEMLRAEAGLARTEEEALLAGDPDALARALGVQPEVVAGSRIDALEDREGSADAGDRAGVTSLVLEPLETSGVPASADRPPADSAEASAVPAAAQTERVNLG